MDVIALLRGAGARVTPQRVMILQTLVDAARHLTAEEIYETVRQTYPVIDRATIYRTLQLFQRVRLVTEIDPVDGSAEYEFAGDGRHHHMACRQCHTTFDLSVEYLESLRETLTTEFGFLPDLHSFTVAGVCAKCAESSVDASAPVSTTRGSAG